MNNLLITYSIGATIVIMVLVYMLMIADRAIDEQVRSNKGLRREIDNLRQKIRNLTNNQKHPQ